MSVAFLFPGQGSQHQNMLHELPKHPEVERTIEEASNVLGRNALELDTKQALKSTVSVQLSLLISGVAIARVLKSEGAVPDIVAGHSIGSFSAAVVSGALEFLDAVSVVELRGKLMEKSYPLNYGMGVIVVPFLFPPFKFVLTQKIYNKSKYLQELRYYQYKVK